MTRSPVKWLELRDGGSEQWLEVKQIGGRKFLFIDITDMHSATGEDTGSRYVSEVKLVDLGQLDDKTIRSAKNSCGFVDGDIGSPLELAECCMDYGASAPLGSFEGNSRGKVHREARALARELLDADALEEHLDSHVVNALGSTAREYMRSDFDSAIQRGCEAGDQSARIMAKMHGVPDHTIDNVRPVDFLPYMVGYQDALSGYPKYQPEAPEELAPEYHRGYDRGVAVKAGLVPAPDWIRNSDKRWSKMSAE